MSARWAIRTAVLVGLVGAATLVWPTSAADHPGTLIDGAHLHGPAGSQNVVYHLPDVDAAFDRWETTWPRLVDQFSIGRTSSGLDLLTVRLTDESYPYESDVLSSGHKVRVYLDASHHGNEYLGTELVMYYLEELLDQATSAGGDAAEFLRSTEIYATPIVNVDGNILDTRKNSRLVDPNRNYPYKWGGPGAGADPTSSTYRGPSAWSEDETRYNGAFIEKIRPDLLITMHTGVAEFYWPWGWTKEPSPDDAFFTSLEKPFEEATRGRVDAMPGWKLYLVSGASDDWSYGTLGVPSFTYEVHELQFLPVYPEPIPEILRDQLDGFDFMIKNVQRMGAWIEPTFLPGGSVDGVDVLPRLLLENLGWGTSTQTQVRLGDRVIDVPDLAPGANHTVDLGPRDIQGLDVTYHVMRIETSAVRTHGLGFPMPPADIREALDTPGPGLAVAAAGALAAPSLLRRRDE